MLLLNFGVDTTQGFSQASIMRILTCLLSAAFLSASAAQPVVANEVSLTEKDLVPVQQGIWAAPEFAVPDLDPNVPLLGAKARQDGAKLLRVLNGSAEINGFSAILYDNRDRGHSILDPEEFPRILQLRYAPGLAAKELDIGLAGRILLPTVVLGNSSMAMRQGPLRRSLPRLAMTNERWREVTALLYTNNQIYVYPEHRDYDASDLFPVNWPYMVVSQGSSGSDRVFLGALAMTLAAFPAETFAKLREARLVAPTLQMILRRTLKSVAVRDDYLSGTAHPPVFDGGQIRAGRMVALASEMRPEDIPPLVGLRVIEEDFITEAGLADLSEQLLDSPAAIGRLWRDYTWEKTLTVTVDDTLSANDRPLTFEWRLLRGNPNLIQIEPQGEDGRRAKITVAWHDPWMRTEPQGNGQIDRRMSRVDIGVFAHNGVHDSAPSMISIDFPDHQRREYAETAAGKRLISIDYAATERRAYFDPVLYWSAPWTDAARYDDSGALVGWDRRPASGEARFIPLAEDKLELDITEN